MRESSRSQEGYELGENNRVNRYQVSGGLKGLYLPQEFGSKKENAQEAME